MNAETTRVDDLITLIEREIILLQGMAATERRLQKAVIGRNWTAVDETIRGMELVSEEIAATEARRHDVFEECCRRIGAAGANAFFGLLASVSPEQRAKLSGLYRELKVAVLAVRSITDGIDAYVSSTMQTLNGVIEELFPERRGKIYSGTGSVDKQGHTALVVDRVS